MQGKKRSETSDEFLVEKKDPLVLPPNYDQLPSPDPTEEEIKLANKSIDASLNNNQRTPDDDPVNVLVAWHVIHASSGLGNIPDSQIEAAVEILNIHYNDVFNYYFTLDTITRHENDDWFVFEPDEQSNQSSDEQQMRSQTLTCLLYTSDAADE